MGYDVTCKAHVGRLTSEGKAMLETDFVQFRSDELRFKVSFKDLLEVTAAGEFLKLKFDGKLARLELGAKVAERWAQKILNPPGRLEKLGIKQGTTVCLEGEFERAFTKEIEGRQIGLAEADLVFVAAAAISDLSMIVTVAKKMRRDAGLWIVYPKGRKDIKEIDVLNAGRMAGLKDIKVVRFSDAETALKFVVPVEARVARRG